MYGEKQTSNTATDFLPKKKDRVSSALPAESLRELLLELQKADFLVDGRSLPYLLSGKEVFLLNSRRDRLPVFEGIPGKQGFLNPRIEEQDGVRKYYYPGDDEGSENGPGTGLRFQIRFPEESPSSPSGPTLSTDLLIYDPRVNRWVGPAESEEDLRNGTLRPDLSTRWDNDTILELAGLASRMDAELPREMVGALSWIFSPETAASLPKRFLQKQLSRIVTGRKPSRGFQLLDDLGALEWFLPELYAARGLAQNRYHRYDIFTHSVYTCDAIPEGDLILRLAGLIHDLGKVETRKEKPGGEATFHNHELVSARHAERITRRFGYPPAIGKRIRFLVRNHMFHYTNDWTDRAVRRFASKIDHETLEDLITLRLADRKGSGKRHALPRAILDLMDHIREVKEKEAEFKIRDLVLDGHDLMNLGIPPGPGMGEILKELHRKVVEGELPNEKESLKRTVLEMNPGISPKETD